MGMFAKRVHQQPSIFDHPSKAEQIRQQEKTERTRANRKRLNASRKANHGNQFAGGQNRKKGRKAPSKITMPVVELCLYNLTPIASLDDAKAVFSDGLVAAL